MLGMCRADGAQAEPGDSAGGEDDTSTPRVNGAVVATRRRGAAAPRGPAPSDEEVAAAPPPSDEEVVAVPAAARSRRSVSAAPPKAPAAQRTRRSVSACAAIARTPRGIPQNAPGIRSTSVPARRRRRAAGRRRTRSTRAPRSCWRPPRTSRTNRSGTSARSSGRWAGEPGGNRPNVSKSAETSPGRPGPPRRAQRKRHTSKAPSDVGWPPAGDEPPDADDVRACLAAATGPRPSGDRVLWSWLWFKLQEDDARVPTPRPFERTTSADGRSRRGRVAAPPRGLTRGYSDSRKRNGRRKI